MATRPCRAARQSSTAPQVRAVLARAGDGAAPHCCSPLPCTHLHPAALFLRACRRAGALHGQPVPVRHLAPARADGRAAAGQPRAGQRPRRLCRHGQRLRAGDVQKGHVRLFRLGLQQQPVAAGACAVTRGARASGFLPWCVPNGAGARERKKASVCRALLPRSW